MIIIKICVQKCTHGKHLAVRSNFVFNRESDQLIFCLSGNKIRPNAF